MSTKTKAVVIIIVVVVAGISLFLFLRNGKAPSTGDEFIIKEAVVSDIEILILESFPVQVNVVAKGQLPDACTEIDEITRSREGSTFSVKITTKRPADELCAQVVTPFTKTISLDVAGLEAGIYRVDVNGVTDLFELQFDNFLEEGEPPLPSPAEIFK